MISFVEESVIGMATEKFKIFRLTDQQAIDAIQKISDEYGDATHTSLTLKLANDHQNPIKGQLDEITEDDDYISISSCDSALFQMIDAKFTKQKTLSLTIRRETDVDEATISFPNESPIAEASKFLGLTHSHLKAYARMESIDKLLGDELSEFYRKRESALLNLEEISQNLIKNNQEFALECEAEKEQHKKDVDAKYQEEAKNLIAGYNSKLEKINDEKQELKRIKSEIDDRESKHARRQIRQDLKKALAEKNTNFNLTENTIKKRMPIHVLFCALLIFSGLFVVTSLVYVFRETDSTISWYNMAKFGLSAITFASSTVFYIRWNDSWFRRHADEEFRLKQLDLDIDRASWAVETALEWQSESGKEIPADLIHRLTENLFSKNQTKHKVNHPADDAVSAIVNASSGLSLNIPGIGEVALDRRGLRNLKKDINESDGE